ncbi:MAG: RNA 2',3'-cyclic phosphodiesterase [Methanobrevibacter ruminantium]|uniref:RNA 2',3'-cyclic phosphodiesterase n=1 Tax=Methanobrevibacter ruminantium TaxID=83816 RepID=UPI0026F1C9AE|nr:RNA 2',3'-cyclic phosphodiesterase [Methanobrevibacter ruminantium]MDD6049133.1 RNA 2',3'-cyclic phosphodiesterase [Methanobrevibacter ruminantium]MDO5842325.1 RNA 2',3'-cyclic phosphodiesterase [Methanobrevibacter ruminantium]
MKVKESKTVRSFLAIELKEDLVPKILDVQKEFKKINANIKYVPSENLHFTLKFFGNIDEDMIEDISNSVEKVIKDYSSFDLNIKDCGCFPNKNVIKVLWLGLDEGSPIKDLQKDLDVEFKKLGFKKERNFISHLTIGRVKSPKNKKQIRETIERLENIEIGQMTVSRICLKKSTLTPQGPIYEDIKIFELN